VLKNYKCTVHKGIFPHAFMNMNELNYIGSKPEYRFYDNGKITREEYNLIPTNN